MKIDSHYAHRDYRNFIYFKACTNKIDLAYYRFVILFLELIPPKSWLWFPAFPSKVGKGQESLLENWFDSIQSI